jgi:hypothetical protein
VRAVNQGQELRRNLTRKGRIPPTYNSSPGASAILDPRAPYGFGRPRPPTTLSPQEPFRKDVEECKKEVRAHAVHDQAGMRTLREKGKLPPSSDSSPGAFQVQEPRAPHGSGRLRPPASLSHGPFIRDEEECDWKWHRVEILQKLNATTFLSIILWICGKPRYM